MTKEIAEFKRRYGLPLIFGIVGAVAGCAASQPPVDDISAADMAVNRAVEARAEEHAPLELRSATGKLVRAKQALEAKQYEKAQQMAEEARVEARLAEAKARSVKVREETHQLQHTVDDLHKEIDRERNE